MTTLKTGSFAEACYNDNTIDGLRAALALRKADPTDCENWGITPTQWREQIKLALAAKMDDLETNAART